MASERQPLAANLRPADLVAEYEFDKDNLTLEWNQMMLATYLNPCCVPCIPCWVGKYYMVDQPNIQDKIASMRLYLTSDNIEFQDGPYYTSFRHNCFGRRGKTQQVIPFDRVQDVRLVEPAGNFCCCFPFRNTLVGVQTAGSAFPSVGQWVPGAAFQAGKAGGAEIDVWGLKDPHGFRQRVFEMKKQVSYRVGDGVGAVDAAVPSDTGTPPPALLGAPKVEQMIAEQVGLLKSIDASLKVLAAKQMTSVVEQ